jgi:tetratricopeptide (TPR) repeat protein
MAKKKAKKGSKVNSFDMRKVYAVLAIFTFVLYANSIPNDYALDDAIVIHKNRFAIQGFEGIPKIFKYDTFTGFFGEEKQLVAGGRYRPLSLVTFAIENQLFGEKGKDTAGNSAFVGNPQVSHFFNVLLYAITGIVLFQILKRLFPSVEEKKIWWSIPFIATLLFLAHPIHTEAIANIKGRDEIMTTLGALLALKYSIDYFDSQKVKYLIFSGLSLFLGLLSKENAITFLAIVPFTLYFFRETNLRKIGVSFLPLIGAAVLFLIIRYAVIGFPAGGLGDELMNNPYLEMNVGQKYATIFYTLLLYIKLLFVPHPLTFDYYPYHIPIVELSDWRFILSLGVYLVMGVFALIKLKQKSVYSYAIIFFLATLSIVSNLFFPIGVFMNERFVYISSIAWCLVVAHFMIKDLPKWISNPKTHQQVVKYGFGAILLLFSLKTITRNPVWENDYSLFQNDVKISKNSAKGNVTAGGSLQEAADAERDPQKQKQMYLQSIQYLERAIEIYPNYVDAMLLLGNGYFKYNQDMENTLKYYFMILERNPYNPNALRNLRVVFNSVKDSQRKLKAFKRANALFSGHDNNLNRVSAEFELKREIGYVYGKELNNLDSSIVYLEEALDLVLLKNQLLQNHNADLKPADASNIRGELFQTYKDLGVAYGMNGNYTRALEVMLNAEKMNPSDKQLMTNIAQTYRQLGDIEKANEYFQKAR